MKEEPLLCLFPSTIKITLIMTFVYKSTQICVNMIHLILSFYCLVSTSLAFSILEFPNLTFKFLCCFVCLFCFTLSFA